MLWKNNQHFFDYIATPQNSLFRSSEQNRINFTEEEKLITKEYPGIPKGEFIQGDDQFMELPLSEYKQNINSEELKEEIKGGDDLALREGIQPTTNGKLIQITYTIRIIPEYKVWWECSLPQNNIKLFISSPKLPSYRILQAPPGWNPQDFESKNFDEPIPIIEK